jgi:hypothetical protein
MMSAGLVAFVGILYAYIAIEQFYLENPAVGVMYLGYAGANVGAWFLVK